MKVSILLAVCCLFMVGEVSSQVATPITVIELFTSQGCSSCPSADVLLNQLVDQKDSRIIGLSFHVSYWNYLGWKDPYSSEQFTDRQRLYASTKRLSSIYTPQMIVDGREEFVGSDRRALTKSLEASRNRKAEYDLKATAAIDNGFLKLRYSVQKSPLQESINIAFVEKLTENFVPRGENSGLTLKHYNVVRKLETVALKQAGEIDIALPSAFDHNKFFVVAFISDKHLEIKGAVQVNL